MPTINIADKPTLDTVKTDTTSVLSRGGLKSNGTDIQAYNSTTSSWDTVSLGGGGSSSITIINKNNFFTDKVFTIKSEDGSFSENITMTGTSITQTVPYAGEYNVSWLYDSSNVITFKTNVTGYGNYPILPIPAISFTDATDGEITLMLNAHYNNLIDITNYWSIGDTRTIHLDAMSAPNPNSSNTWAAQDITVVIVDFNHTDLAIPINGHTKAAITVQTREVLSGTSAGSEGTIYIDGIAAHDTSFTKWSNLYMRTYLNDKVWGAFPSSLKSIIKTSKHYCHTTYNGSESEEVTDNLFLPSIPEILGTAPSYYVATDPVEGTIFSYYTTASSRIKYRNNNGSPVTGTAVNWWSGSPYNSVASSGGTIVFYWDNITTSGSVSSSSGGTACNLAPAFCL